MRSNGNISVRTINTSGSDGGDVTINAGGTFRAIGTFLAGDFVDGSTNANSVAGRAALGARLLMSINATGVSSGGAKVQIRQGGTAFQVGSNFVVDNSGAVIYREFTIAADGAIVLGDRVMPASRANGSINFGSFVRANGDVVNRFNVIAVSKPLNITDPTVSFTAGAITSNQENAGLVVSVRDRLFITDLAAGGRIGITFGLPPIVPPVIPDSQTVQRQINNQTSGSGCNQATTIASSTSKNRSFNNTHNPCAVTNDEAQILKILGESPNLDQNKFWRC